MPVEVLLSVFSRYINDSDKPFHVGIELIEIYNQKFQTNLVGNEDFLRFDKDMIEIFKNWKNSNRYLNHLYIDTIPDEIYENDCYKIFINDEDHEEDLYIDYEKLTLKLKLKNAEENIFYICDTLRNIIEDDENTDEYKMNIIQLLFTTENNHEIHEFLNKIRNNAEYLPTYSQNYKNAKKRFDNF